jgi:hypothetical protein
VDTPERGDRSWGAATAHTYEWVTRWEESYCELTALTPLNDKFRPFMVRTMKSDSFGRYLAEVWPYSHMSEEHCLNEHLISLGYGLDTKPKM